MKAKLMLLLLLIGLLAKPAHAYIDPGTGSVFFQVFAAAVIGGFFAFKTKLKALWAKATALFTKKQNDPGK